MKFLIKKLKNLVHFFYAWYGAVKYHHPSDELLVIGITGTTGKSSVIHFLRQVLEEAGYKVGSLSTVDFYVAGEEKLNDQKMTMLGKMQIQKYLRAMADKKCQVAILEVTSEGRLQHRHRFINYDLIALTNLYPEHIESHGSFENYKQAKLDIFKYVSKLSRKREIRNWKLEIGGQLDKVGIVNGDSEYADEFLQYNFDQKIKFNVPQGTNQITKTGLDFAYKGYHFNAPLYGRHNIENLITVISIVRAMDMPWQDVQKAISKLTSPPGRIEFIPEAEKLGFQVIVDYAFEPRALQALYEVVKLLQPQRVIQVTGNCGGGRDKPDAKAKLITQQADIVVVTNEDPYDDDPKEIIEYMAKVMTKAGKKEGETLFKVLDRKEGIKKALNLAKKGDLILITGKGSEQAMCVAGGKMIPWDDREVVREVL